MSDDFLIAKTIGDLALWVILRIPLCPHVVALDVAQQVFAKYSGTVMTDPSVYVGIYLEAEARAIEQMGV